MYASGDTANYSVDTTTTPVLLTDFFITPDQVGLAAPSNNDRDSSPPRNMPHNDYYDAPPVDNPGSYYFNESPPRNHPRDPFYVVSDRARFRDSMEHRHNCQQGYAYRQEQRARPNNQGPQAGRAPKSGKAPNMVLTRLKFRGKRRPRSSSPNRRSPASTPSGSGSKEQAKGGTTTHEQHSAEEPADESNRMETTN